jgi:uncharacterized membrane protein HdeD (DUF308 family)
LGRIVGVVLDIAALVFGASALIASTYMITIFLILSGTTEIATGLGAKT